MPLLLVESEATAAWSQHCLGDLESPEGSYPRRRATVRAIITGSDEVKSTTSILVIGDTEHRASLPMSSTMWTPSTSARICAGYINGNKLGKVLFVDTLRAHLNW